MKKALLSILLAGTLAVTPAASVLASTAASQPEEESLSELLNYIGSMLEETGENLEYPEDFLEDDQEEEQKEVQGEVQGEDHEEDQDALTSGIEDSDADIQESDETDDSDELMHYLSILFAEAEEEDAEASEDEHEHEDGHIHEDEHEHEEGHVHEDEHEHEEGDVHEDEHEHEEGHVHEDEHEHEEGHVHEAEEFEFEDWNPDAPSLAKLTEFVESVCDESSETYVPESERIAVFDMDGTVYGELAPIYVEWLLFVHRALDDPNYQADDEMTEVAKRVIQAAKDRSIPEDLNRAEALDQIRSFEGMTIDEFADYVNEFLMTDVWGFSGMTYGDAFYAPIIEVIDYLDANDFTVYLVSGSDRYLCRTLIDGILAIEPEHVIGMDPLLKASSQGDNPGYDFNMSADDEIIRSGDLVVKNLKVNKVTAIIKEIGHQPILSFGNSGGDVSMGLYVTTDNKYPSEAFMLVADDDERDWADASKAPGLVEKWEGYGFNVISMKNDFRTIYGDDVVRDKEMPEIIVPGEDEDSETEAESTAEVAESTAEEAESTVENVESTAEETESTVEEVEPAAEEAESTVEDVESTAEDAEEENEEDAINALVEGIAEEVAVAVGMEEAAAEELAEEVAAAVEEEAAVEEIAKEVAAAVGLDEAAVEEVAEEVATAVGEEEAALEEIESEVVAAIEEVIEELDASEEATEDVAASEEATEDEAAAEETKEDEAAAEETKEDEAAEETKEDVAASEEATDDVAAAEEKKDDEAAADETTEKDAEAETEEKQETAEDTVYVVGSGENLWKIAAKTLGSGSEYKKIADANGIEAPYEIEPGQELIIPAA